MSVAIFRERVQQAVMSVSAQPNSPLTDLRQRGFAAFERMSVPTPRNEEWKYTNVIPLFTADLQIAPVEIQSDPVESWVHLGSNISQALGDDTIVVHLHHGRWRTHSTVSGNVQGLEIVSLSTDLLASDPTLCELVGSVVPIDGYPFVALNAALHHEVLVVRLRAGTHVRQPIHVVVSADTTVGSVMQAPRLLVVAETDSSVMVVESHHTTGQNSAVSAPVTEVLVHAGASVRHVKIIADSGGGKHVGTTAASVARDGMYASHVACLQGAFTRNDLIVRLQEPAAQATLDGVSVLNDSEVADNHTVVDHRAPHCRSEELYKGVYDDRSMGVFNGKIYVQPHAQKTEAYQSSHALLLSDRATMNAKPQLEIWADDVKCSHGATTGQLNEEAVFYMQARGIGKAEAKALMTYAFAAEVLERLPHDGLRNLLEQQIATKLGSVI